MTCLDTDSLAQGTSGLDIGGLAHQLPPLQRNKAFGLQTLTNSDLQNNSERKKGG